MSEKKCSLCGSSFTSFDLSYESSKDKKAVCGVCIINAVGMLKSIAAGNAVLIRKINGKWPCLEMSADGRTTVWDGEWCEETKTFENPQEAMKEWEEKK